MNGIFETTFIRKEELSSSDIGLGTFSGYIGFIGETSSQFGGTPGKVIGGVFAVVGGVITGGFDSQLNPNKEFDNLVGSALLGLGSAWMGGKLGLLIGGPVGAIIGATVGSVVGTIWGDDLYDYMESKLPQYNSLSDSERGGLASQITNGDLSGLLYGAYNSSSARYDPLILDLNGDGVKTISQQISKAFFDLSGDGMSEQTGWVDSNDGFLVFDANGNTIKATSTFTQNSFIKFI